MSKLSVVVSVYNEEDSLDAFYNAIKDIFKQIPFDSELIFVNDGSVDNSVSIIEKLAEFDDRVKAVIFSRNYGHDAAMIAGLDHATGDYIVCMDADLQHPVKSLCDICDAFKNGAEVVLMARQANKDAGLFKNITSSAFYKLFNMICKDKFVPGVSDFFGMSKRVADIFRQSFRERNRYLRGYLQTVGFKREVISYEAADRFAGESKYSIKSLFRVFFIAITGFSNNLLRIGYYMSAFSLIAALVLAIVSIVRYVNGGVISTILIICAVLCLLFGGLYGLVSLAGEYLYTVVAENRDRPIYIVDRTIGISGKE
ncbi:MAG: glycosyltransferase family 2 protein [Lachnospiraceae bacterium]|nr:glycosyltransferase family 2 protein [Lachnospiraceae bacterium]